MQNAKQMKTKIFASSLQDLNEAIRKEYSHVTLQKNGVYFEVVARDIKTAEHLRSLMNTCIRATRVKDLSIEGWKAEVKRILNQTF